MPAASYVFFYNTIRGLYEVIPKCWRSPTIKINVEKLAIIFVRKNDTPGSIRPLLRPLPFDKYRKFSTPKLLFLADRSKLQCFDNRITHFPLYTLKKSILLEGICKFLRRQISQGYGGGRGRRLKLNVVYFSSLFHLQFMRVSFFYTLVCS